MANSQSAPDRRLVQKTTVQADSKPSRDVIQELADKHKLPVDFDASVAANGSGQTPFSLSAEGITLASALNLVCRADNLAYTVEKGRLLVTSRDADETQLLARDYAFNALGPLAADPQVLMHVLQSTTGALWKDIDGVGGEIVALSPRGVTIRQTRAAHQEIQEWFEQLSAAATGRARPPSVQDRAEQVIQRKLQAVGSLPAGELSLSDLLDQLLRKNGVAYWVDRDALLDQNIAWADLKSTVDDKKLSPAARLDAALAAHKLTWQLADEVVIVTTQVHANEDLSARVYDVRKLLSPNRSIDALASQLRANKELGPWEEVDGTGGCVEPLNSLLIVRQNAAAHAKIAAQLK
jgi:hypothetical protein